MRKFAIYTLFLALTTASSGQDYRIIEQNGNRIRLQVTAELPAVADDGTTQLNINKAGPIIRTSRGYSLPWRPLLLQLGGRSAYVEILSIEKDRISTEPPDFFVDQAVGADSISALNAATAPQYADPSSVVKISPLGRFRQNHLWRVDVYPFDYDEKDGELIVRRSIVFDVIVDEPFSGPVQPVPEYETDFMQKLGAVPTTNVQPATSVTLRKKAADAGERWKIILNQDGIYRITGQDLLDAGVDLLKIDFRNIRLTRNGSDVALYPAGWRDGQFDPEDYIEFWGEEQRQTFQDKAPDLYQDLFTSSSTYWLSWESRGLWMAEESGQIADSNPGEFIRPYSFLETVHHEEDNYFDHLSSVPMDTLRDHWFFDDGISAGKKVDYKIFLHHPDDQSPLKVSARVMMSGRTTIKNLKHNISAYLNGSFLFSHRWEGQAIADLTSSENYITGADLQDGENVLSIVNNVTPQNFDFVLLNWFEVTYPRLYRAFDDFLKFRIPPDYENGTFLFRIDGFSDQAIDVYKLHQSKIIGGQVEETTDFNDFTSMRISFQNDVLSPATEFVAVANSAKKKPQLIIKDEPSDLKNSQLSADYLLIAHHRFIDSPALQQLIELRQAQGLHVLKIDVQDIYDEFNYGQPGSYAIKDFLAWALDNWQPPKLKYVLFVGDGSYIRYSAEGDTLDFIPVYMRQTLVFGAAASDFWYTLISGEDETPDINLGRLPVRSTEELEALVAKMIRYETSPPSGDWPNRFLIIGGNGVDFRSQGLALSKTVPPQFDTRMLFTVKDPKLDDDPYFGGSSDLLDWVDQGCSVITFHGHGGGAIWADNGLLRLDDIDRFYTQGKFPFILSMTCYTGAFESPVRESLADALLFTEDEGAIAMFGASGVGWTWNDYFLQTEILKQIYSHPDMTIGEMVTAGKISYMAHYKTEQVLSQINQYHLLGDPASRIVLPQQQVEITLDNPVVLREDSVRVSCRPSFEQGRAWFSVEDSLKLIVAGTEGTVVNNEAKAELRIPLNFSGDAGLIRFYGADDFGGNRSNGYASISLKGAVFDSAFVERTPEDSLYFHVQVSSRSSLTQVLCFALNDTLDLQTAGDGWYVSTRAVKAMWTGFQFSYYFQAHDVESHVYTSRLYKFYINLDVDVAADSANLHFVGSDLVYLEMTINNSAGNDVQKLPILYEQGTADAMSWTPIGIDTLDIPAYASEKSRIYFAPAPGPVWIRATLDPDSLLQEENRRNNVIIKHMIPKIFQASPQGFIVNNKIVQTLLFDDNFEIELPEGALSSASALLVDTLRSVKINDQPDFSIVSGAPAYRLALLGESVEQSLPLTVQLRIAADSSHAELYANASLFRFLLQTKKWLRCDTEASNWTWRATLPQVADVALLKSFDATPPDIQLAVDGQPYVLKKWAGREPRLGVRLQDVNGVDISAGRLRFELNGSSVDASEIALPDSIADGNQIVISYNPQLQPGEQVITIQATDCNQNISEVKEFVLRVANDFDIQMLGNYPNPFKTETRFAYIFNSPVEKVSLKIFTTSGRLIRHIRESDISDDPNPLSADYHEILWDGLDSEGYEAANGVYFYALAARSDGKTKTINGKLAKIK